MTRTFIRCCATVPREAGVFTCDLPANHSSSTHVHVCLEPGIAGRPFTKWKILPCGRRWSRPQTAEGYLEQYRKAMEEFRARP